MPSPDASRPSPRGAGRPHLPASPIEEGVLVARSALRLSIKNSIIMLTLRDEKPWNDDDMIELARREIETLMAELTQTAERLEAASAAPRRARRAREPRPRRALPAPPRGSHRRPRALSRRRRVRALQTETISRQRRLGR